MTTEERLQRIEHLTAGTAEERRKDREEYKTLWRDTQRQINELAGNLNRLSLDTRNRLDQVADQIEATGHHLRELGEATDRKLRELGEATDARIAALTSAIGAHLREGHPPPQA